MSIRIKTIAVASLAMSASAFALSNTALAAPTINFAIQVGQFSTPPTMEFKFKGGKYVWEQKAINTHFAASANTNDNWLEWYGPLHVATLGVGGAASFTGNVPEGVEAWSLEGPMQFPVSFLNAYQGNFAEYCNANGGTKTIVKHGLSILFTVRQAYEEERLNGDPAPEQIDEDGVAVHTFYAHRTVTMPVVVVCGAKPASTQPRPGGVVQKEPDFKVKSIALNYGGVPGKTKPNPATECKQAKLTVSFKTSKAGVVDFRLHKQIGNGPIQAKNLQVYAKFDGNAHFVASHQEIVSVEKTTMVQAMAEELVNPINLKTGWKDVTLRCEDIGGGYASTPKSGGSGTQSAAPAKPNAAFGTRPQTQAPFKPVTAPAVPKKPVETKTAPVAPRKPAVIKTAPGRHGGAEQVQPRGRIGQVPAVQHVR